MRGGDRRGGRGGRLAVELENERLKRENEALRRENERLRSGADGGGPRPPEPSATSFGVLAHPGAYGKK